MISGQELRAVMRDFPAGVAVVTVEADGARLGLTLGSLISLSLEPPLVGFAVRRDAALHELLRGADGFAVSLLAEGQAAIAQHFARGVPPIALWHGIETREEDGAPLLEGALGWLRCRLWAEWAAGDHTFFAGEVLSVEKGSASGGLVYAGHRYLPA